MAIKSWLMALRLKTLSAAIVPVVVGTALVSAEGEWVIWPLSAYALLGALFIQIGTNLINDAIDFKKGADTEHRVGPQRVTQSGLLSHKWVMFGGFFSFMLAVACGIPLVIQGGNVIIAIGLLSLFFGYTYTGGPFPLAYRGLGDLFVILFFGLIAVGGVYYLHTLSYSWSAVVAGLQVGLLATVLIAINNLRDIEQDRLADKKTLAVRFGKKFARMEILWLIALAYFLSIYWVWQALLLPGLLPLLTLPLGRSLVNDVAKNEPGPVYNEYLARASILHIVFGFQLALGLFLGW